MTIAEKLDMFQDVTNATLAFTQEDIDALTQDERADLLAKSKAVSDSLRAFITKVELGPLQKVIADAKQAGKKVAIVKTTPALLESARQAVKAVSGTPIVVPVLPDSNPKDIERIIDSVSEAAHRRGVFSAVLLVECANELEATQVETSLGQVPKFDMATGERVD